MGYLAEVYSRNLQYRQDIYKKMRKPDVPGLIDFEMLYPPIKDYFLPNWCTNETTMARYDDVTDYVDLLERDTRNLSQRVAELENQFASIKKYIPTIVRMLEEFETAEMRIENKKKFLREKYTLRERAPLKLWTGTDQEVDIADTSLDEMLANMDE